MLASAVTEVNHGFLWFFQLRSTGENMGGKQITEDLTVIRNFMLVFMRELIVRHKDYCSTDQ